MKVALATSTTPAATGRRSRGMVTPCGLRLDGVVKANTGFDNTSSERSRVRVILNVVNQRSTPEGAKVKDLKL